MIPEGPTQANERISVIGLGVMGLQMSLRLSERYSVHGYDPYPSEDARTADRDIDTFTLHEELNGAIDGSRFFLVMVRTEDQLIDLLFGASNLVRELRSGSVLIIGSTIGIEAVRTTAGRLDGTGILIVDAPVSGGAARARSGQLLMTVGTAPDTLDAVHSVLSHLASNLISVGDVGAGQAFKTVNQLLCGVHIVAAAEALALAKRLGLDPDKTLDALQQGAAQSFMLGDRGPRIIDHIHGEEPDVKSRVDLFTKDMKLVLDSAHSSDLGTPLAAAALQSFLLTATNLDPADDDSAVAKLYLGS